MSDRVPVTIQGYAALEKELKEAKARRPDIIEAIAVARAHGDLRENAEYHAARERQSMAEARNQDIEYKLSMAQVIDVTAIPNTGKVIFGTTVDLLNLDTNKKVSYKIVGVDESDVDRMLIAYDAPIARALIGKSVADTVEIGEIRFTIKAVHHNA